MSFDKMIEEFKDYSELKTYSEAQYKTILEITKKNQQLIEELNHLKQLFEHTPLTIDENIISKYDEEVIAKIQLAKLKEKSMTHELTLEESKRVEIFSKILANIRNNNRSLDTKGRKLSDQDLLSVLDNGNTHQ